MTSNELKAKRDELVAQARKSLREAENLSDEIGEGFSWNLAYGMGGYYQAAGEYEDSEYEDSDSSAGEWVSSSATC